MKKEGKNQLGAPPVKAKRLRSSLMTHDPESKVMNLKGAGVIHRGQAHNMYVQFRKVNE